MPALFLLFSDDLRVVVNLESMIGLRALQASPGASSSPLAFNLVLKLLPPAQRGLGFALFGMTATFGAGHRADGRRVAHG